MPIDKMNFNKAKSLENEIRNLKDYLRIAKIFRKNQRKHRLKTKERNVFLKGTIEYSIIIDNEILDFIIEHYTKQIEELEKELNEIVSD